MAKAGYRIGEVAAETGFPASTLRYYEDEGLLPAPDRTAAGHRLYHDKHLRRLRFMSRAKRLGLSLEEIAHLADAWANHDCSITHEQLVRLLDAKLHQVHDEIVELTRFAEQLQDVIDRMPEPPTEGRPCGPDCSCAPAFIDEAPRPADRRFGALPLAP